MAEEHDGVIPINTVWRYRLSEASKLKRDQLENVFYAAGEYGASFTDTCAYFGLSRQGADNEANAPLKIAHESGLAALRMKLRRTQVEVALNRLGGDSVWITVVPFLPLYFKRG